jgi:hypothetical protein
MEPGEIDGRTVGTGVNVASGIGDGAIDASGDATGFGDGDSFGDGVGDAFDFFFPDKTFAFFFFAGVGVFFGVGFFFLGDGFGFGLGGLLGVGDVFAAASGFSSDETCAEAGVTAKTLAIISHKQKRATAHVTKKESQAGCSAGAEFPRSCSRRRIAFSFPPSNSNKQVRYIQVSRMIMEASA